MANSSDAYSLRGCIPTKYYITNGKSERNSDGLGSTKGLGRLSYGSVSFTNNQGNKAWKDDQKKEFENCFRTFPSALSSNPLTPLAPLPKPCPTIEWTNNKDRLQNSPYWYSSTYARAVKQKVWNETENRERDWEDTLRIRFFLSPHTPFGFVRLARFAPVRLLRHALLISLVILRKNPTVLQSIIKST